MVTLHLPVQLVRMHPFQSIKQARDFYARRRAGYGHRAAAMSAGALFYLSWGL